MNSEMSAGGKVEMIFEEAKRIGLTSLPFAIAYIALLAGGSTLVDAMAWNTGGDLLINIASLILSYMLVKFMIEKSGIAPDGMLNGFGTYFGIALLSGFGTVLGILLLVIPGLILMIRWSAAYGYGLAGGHGATEALGESWRATEGHWLSVGMALLVPFTAFVIGLGVYFLSIDEFGVVNVPLSGLGNAMMSLGTVLSTAIGLAVYSLTANPVEEMVDVFE